MTIHQKSENYLLGISDYYWYRNSPPKWMHFKLHLKEWKAGWEWAKLQDINTDPLSQTNKARTS